MFMITSRSPHGATLLAWRCCGIALLLLVFGQIARAQNCQATQKTLDGLVSQRAALTDQFHAAGTAPADRTSVQQALKTLAPQISTAQRGLLECLRPPANVAVLP